MQVLMVASECAPFVKTGGLADVVGALPQALADAGVQTRVLLPAYPALFPYLPQGEEVARWDDLPGGPARVVAVTVERVALLLLDAPQLYDRPGGPYVDADGKDWTDNAARFASLAMAGARIGMAGVAGFAPDVLHAHDWQAALAPVYLKMAGADLPSVLTIHNIAFQGRFGPQMLGPLGLDPTWYHPDGLEFYGDLSFLKGGLVYADRITTVSPKYAREILTAEFGMGLEGVLQARGAALSGILNGIDTSVWDPANDPALPRGYDARSLGRKKLARQEVAARLDLEPDHAGPLFCVISRLTEQKGLDALLEAVPYLVDRGGQLAVLGSGDRGLEDGFRAAAVAHPGRVGVQIGYDEAFSHILQAGSDSILIPSRFEPCGLTQLYALRYGTLPVVTRTGGLADTVIDANPAALAAGAATGVMMGGASPTALRGAIDRVMELYADRETWTRMQRAAMRQPVGWERSAQAYAALYRDMAA